MASGAACKAPPRPRPRERLAWLGLLLCACNQGVLHGPVDAGPVDALVAAADCAPDGGVAVPDAAVPPHDAPEPDAPPNCPNAACDSGETCATCPADCGPCPDVGSCNPAPCMMLFMSPSGDDTRDGLTPATAVKTLTRIAAILTATPYHQGQNVEVRIEPGTYDNYTGKNRINWSPALTSPVHTISFLPIDYTVGSGATPTRPVFDGTTTSSCAGPSNCAPPGYFFYVDAGTVRVTNLRFYHLQIQDYGAGGIAFVHADGNTVLGNLFTRIGNKWSDDGSYISYAAVALHWSSDNVVTHNEFVDIEARDGSCTSAGNTCSDCRACLHALYLAHGADHNDATYNRIERVSGDPLRTRDNSNYNTFSYYSSIRQAGKTAFYSEWYNPDVGECPSWENRFQYNADLSCGYLGETFAKSWCYSRKDVTCEDGTYLPAGCTKPISDAVRLRTYMNDTDLCP